MSNKSQPKPRVYPTLGQEGILDWLKEASFIIYDAMNANALNERLLRNDEATELFWNRSLGLRMWEDQRFILITQLAKLYCPGKYQELTIQGVIAQMRKERGQKWMTKPWTKLKVFTPVSNDIEELFTKLDALDVEVRSREDLYAAIETERNNVTAHTRAPHRTGPAPEIVAFREDDIACLLDLALRVHNTINQDIGGKAYQFALPDVHGLDQLIADFASCEGQRIAAKNTPV